jgi:hypothetical protein
MRGAKTPSTAHLSRSTINEFSDRFDCLRLLVLHGYTRLAVSALLAIVPELSMISPVYHKFT